jgi:hypothetical protein
VSPLEKFESIVSQLPQHAKLKTELVELFEYNQRNQITADSKPDEYELEMMDFIRRYILGHMRYHISHEDLSNPYFLRSLAKETWYRYHSEAPSEPLFSV